MSSIHWMNPIFYPYRCRKWQVELKSKSTLTFHITSQVHQNISMLNKWPVRLFLPAEALEESREVSLWNLYHHYLLSVSEFKFPTKNLGLMSRKWEWEWRKHTDILLFHCSLTNEFCNDQVLTKGVQGKLSITDQIPRLLFYFLLWSRHSHCQVVLKLS